MVSQTLNVKIDIIIYHGCPPLESKNDQYESKKIAGKTMNVAMKTKQREKRT